MKGWFGHSASSFLFCSVLLLFLFYRQGLTTNSCVAWALRCRPSLPWTHVGSPIYGFRLSSCVTMSGSRPLLLLPSTLHESLPSHECFCFTSLSRKPVITNTSTSWQLLHAYLLLRVGASESWASACLLMELWTQNGADWTPVVSILSEDGRLV